jgi:hypothetical protein
VIKRLISLTVAAALLAVGGVAAPAAAETDQVPHYAVDSDPATTTAPKPTTCPLFSGPTAGDTGSLTYWLVRCGSTTNGIAYGFGNGFDADTPAEYTAVAIMMRDFVRNSSNAQIQRIWLRYNHEANGASFDWACKTTTEFRDDFIAFVDGVKAAEVAVGMTAAEMTKIKFSLALNYGTQNKKADCDPNTPGDQNGPNRGYRDDYWDSRFPSRVDVIDISYYSHEQWNIGSPCLLSWDGDQDKYRLVYTDYWTRFNLSNTLPVLDGPFSVPCNSTEYLIRKNPLGLIGWYNWATAKGETFGLGEWGSGSFSTINPTFIGLTNAALTTINNNNHLSYNAYMSGGYDEWEKYNPNLNAVDWDSKTGWIAAPAYTFPGTTCSITNNHKVETITPKNNAGVVQTARKIARLSDVNTYVSSSCGPLTKWEWWVFRNQADWDNGVPPIASGSYMPPSPVTGTSQYALTEALSGYSIVTPADPGKIVVRATTSTGKKVSGIWNLT